MSPIILAIALQASAAPMFGTPPSAGPQSYEPSSSTGDAAHPHPRVAGQRVSPRPQDSVSGVYSIDPRSTLEARKDMFDRR